MAQSLKTRQKAHLHSNYTGLTFPVQFKLSTTAMIKKAVGLSMTICDLLGTKSPLLVRKKQV